MTPRQRDILGMAAIALLALLAHAPSLAGGFLWDDALLITDNVLLRDGAGLRDIWLSGKATDYYPVTWSALWLAWQAWGDTALGYRGLNLALHIAGALLLWRVLRQLNTPWAWLGAALFAIHPVTVASVAWPSQIKNTLSLVPFMAAAWSYLRFDTLNQRRWYFASLVCFALALLSKSSTVVLPALLAVMIAWRHGRLPWRHLLALTPMLLLAIGAAGLTVIFQTQQAIAGGDPRPEGLLSRLAAAGWVLWFYLRQSLAPVDLMMVYPRWQVDEHRLVAWLPLAAWVAPLGLLAWRVRHHWRQKPRATPAAATLFALLGFTLALVPVLGIMTMYYARFSLVSDHLQYLALPAITGLVGAGLGWRARSVPGRGPRIVAALLLLTWGTLTFVHAGTFRDEPTMWAANLEADPQSWMGAHGVARALVEQGRIDEAAELFERSLQLNPDYERAHVNLGLIRARQGRLDEAIAHFSRAAAIQPRYAQAHRYLGRALADKGQLTAAADHLRAATLLKPALADLRLEWALVLLRGQRVDEALEQLAAAVALDPELDAARFNLAQALLQRGRAAEAMPHLRLLTQKQPDDPAVRGLLEQAQAAIAAPSP